MKLSPSLLAAAFVFISTSAMGQTILAEYTFTSGSYNASNIDSAITASAISRAVTSIGATASAHNLYYQLRHDTPGLSVPQSQEAALGGSVYVSLTLGVVDQPVYLGTLTFDFGNHGTAYTMEAYAFATVTIGGVTTLYTSTIYDTVTEETLPYYKGRAPATTTDTLGMATINFGGLQIDSTAEIRLYTWYDNLQHREGSTALPPATTAYTLRVDNMVFTSEAIPEAGTVTLLLAGAAAAFAYHRNAARKL